MGRDTLKGNPLAINCCLGGWGCWKADWHRHSAVVGWSYCKHTLSRGGSKPSANRCLKGTHTDLHIWIGSIGGNAPQGGRGYIRKCITPYPDLYWRLMSVWDGIHANLNSSCGEKESSYLSLTCTECIVYLGYIWSSQLFKAEVMRTLYHHISHYEFPQLNLC